MRRDVSIHLLATHDSRIRHPQPGSIPPRATKKAKPSLVITGAFCISSLWFGGSVQQLDGCGEWVIGSDPSHYGHDFYQDDLTPIEVRL